MTRAAPGQPGGRARPIASSAAAGHASRRLFHEQAPCRQPIEDGSHRRFSYTAQSAASRSVVTPDPPPGPRFTPTATPRARIVDDDLGFLAGLATGLQT